MTLSNPEGHADLTFTVNERPQGSTIAGEGSGAAATAAGVRSNQAPAGHTRPARHPVTSPVSRRSCSRTSCPGTATPSSRCSTPTAIAFDQAGSGEIASLDFSGYHAIYVGNDQPQSFYDAVFANEAKFTAFVDGGGFLWFGAAAFGFQDGDLDGAVLPGGLTVHGPDYEDENTVAPPTIR